jgi:hypothetical protein
VPLFPIVHMRVPMALAWGVSSLSWPRCGHELLTKCKASEHGDSTHRFQTETVRPQNASPGKLSIVCTAWNIRLLTKIHSIPNLPPACYTIFNLIAIIHGFNQSSIIRGSLGTNEHEWMARGGSWGGYFTSTQELPPSALILLLS